MIKMNKKIDRKVLLIGSAGGYGAQISMYYLAYYLRQKGIDVIAVLPEHGEMEARFSENGIKCVVIKNALCWYKKSFFWKRILIQWIKAAINLVAQVRLSWLIRREKPDIVHINSIGISVGAYPTRKYGKILVWHIREFVEEDLNRKLYNDEKTYKRVNSSDAVIVTSEALSKKYQNYIERKKLHLIYNGVEPLDYGSRSHIILQKNIVKIIMAGRICQEKGQRELLESLYHLEAYKDMLEIEFVGDGNGDNSEFYALEELVQRIGWEKQICFSGYCTDMLEKFKEADICVVASKMEAFGRVTVEAMMAGNLVIGADSGGTAELLKDGRGLLYWPGDKKRLAGQIIYAIKNREDVRHIAEKGREYAFSCLTAEKNAQNIIELYIKLGQGR